MKCKLVIVAVAVVAAALGFWAGGNHARVDDERRYEQSFHLQRHFAEWEWGQVTLSVLKNLAEGRQNEARATLETRLNRSLIAMMAYYRTFYPKERGPVDVNIIREAREYRVRHPWASTNTWTMDAEEAFKWAQ